LKIVYRASAYILFFLVLMTTGFSSANASCLDGSTACSLDDRSYWVLPPEKWDGKSPLPVMLYFHGWGRQGNVPVKHKHIGQVTRQAGVLLVAPDGLGKSWDFWRPGSRDTIFANAVLDDVAKNFPIKPSRLIVSGYSWGSSMAWRYACESGEKVSVLLGISGTFYDQSENCETGPVEVRHVHGLKDTVMDFPFGPNGEETGPVRLWQRINGCSNEPKNTSEWNTSQTFNRHEWHGCKSGKTITLDVHGGGHWIARGWMKRQLEELLISSSDS